jgi:hypothetical protein
MAITPAIWFKLARRVGGQYVRTGDYGSVILKVRGGIIRLERVRFPTHHPDSSGHMTRMSGSYAHLDDFKFSIRTNTPLQKVGTLLGMQDIEVGDPGFDSAFVVRASDPQKARELCGDELMRRTLLSVNERRWLTIEARDCLDEDADRLVTALGSRRVIVWEQVGLEDDEQRLSEMFEVFERVLGRLCDLGVACPDG